MKYTLFARQATQQLAATCFAMLILVPAAARAAECPASSPEDPQERRKLAKEWFATAESAENAGNDAESKRAYACSYKMVAHPFTAYNLGRVAERSGDSELALKMFKAYLTLKPDAQDKDEVKDKVKALEEKMAAGPTAPGEPPQATDGSAENPQSKEDLAPPPEPRPPVTHARAPEPEPEPRGHVVEWVVGGVSVAALVGGIALNLGARSKMSACETHAGDPQKLGTANSECDAARPLAYWSYGLFTVAAVGAAVDTVLLILRSGEGESSSSSRDEASLGFTLVPGGGAVTARGRF